MKNSLLILLITCALNSRAGDSIVLKLDVKTSFFTTDNLGNIYFINDKNEIIKFSGGYNGNNTDTTFITYSNKNLGRPTLIDASNAMKVLVFYPDYNSVVLLDNKLAELSVIRFNNFNTVFYQPAAVCKESESDHIWIYDDLSRKLFKLDETGNIIAQSEPFDQLFEFGIRSPNIFAADDALYFDTDSNGILIFDTYSNLVINLPALPAKINQVTGDHLIITDGDRVFIFSIETANLVEIQSPEKNTLQINIRGENVFLRTADSISVYQR
ncbi:MAG: hypothetical protein ACHQFW_10660 [Chitinophagales bacterium]